MTRFAVALGSNLGDRLSYLREAIAGLGGLGLVRLTSAVYETHPVGGPDQGPFLNAVTVIESRLAPLALLDHCQQMESDAGRVRDHHWGPRTLDIDILASDGPRVDDDRLQIPHPMAAVRPFVLVPLVEVWPEAPVGEGLDAATALAMVGRAGVVLYAETWV